MNNNMNITTLGDVYSGQVEIKLIKDKKAPFKIVKKHNKSTGAFHKYILDTLTGTYSKTSMIYGVRLIGSNSNALYNDLFPGAPLFGEAQKLNDTTYGLIDPYYIKYNFLIPQTFTLGKDLYRVQLCNRLGEVYAEVDTTNKATGAPLELTAGSNLDITWSLIISSVIVESESEPEPESEEIELI